MQRFALVVGDAVREIVEIESDSPPIEDRYHPDLLAGMHEVDANVQAGWLQSWDGFAPPPPPDPPLAPAPEPAVTARQLRLWLIGAGVPLDAVTQAIGSLPAEMAARALLEWEYSTQFERASPLVAQIGEALGLDAVAIDGAFAAAAAL